MASSGQHDPRDPSSPQQSIPLRVLRPPDSSYGGRGEWDQERGRSHAALGASTASYGGNYERLEDVSLGPSERIPLREPIPRIQEPVDYERGSPIEPANFQTAIGFAGLSLPRLSVSQPEGSTTSSGMEEPEFDIPESQRYLDSNDADFQPVDSDQVPLTNPNSLQPLSGAHTAFRSRQSSHRSGFLSVDFGSPDSRNQGSMLGDDLPRMEAGYGRSRSRSFGDTLSPIGRQRSVSPSTSESPLSRAGSIMRAMSQRVVNLSNEPEPSEILLRRRASSTAEVPVEGIPPIHITSEDTAYRPDRMSSTPVEKKASIVSEEFTFANSPPLLPNAAPATNPFKGKSLGIFSPTNPIRLWLCDILVNPMTEIVILILIVLLTVLLAVQSSSLPTSSSLQTAAGDLYTNALNHSHHWGDSFFDYAILALFVIFTLEIIARIIVSGFFFNAAEYSTIDREKGIRAAMINKYRTFFGPQHEHSVKTSPDSNVDVFSNSLARSFTAIQGNSLPTSIEELQRQQLARRAFLRHSLNRIDFVSVVSFWISFLLSITGTEASTHLHLFKMMSCLRILRLLYITSGTSIILKSLKKAAPLLVNVSFLIGFFWLLFAIIGVQAFKSSFRRQCVWQDPNNQANYTQNFTLCGGHLDLNGKPQAWIYGNGSSSAKSPKGYLCPRGVLCVEQIPLYNGTVSFDNILNSLELVFVLLGSNTFADLMYYTINSDYPVAALYFAGGIVIMTLWLNNLLIAVITSSFQVIREESKQSAFAATIEPVSLPQQGKTRKRNSVLKFWYDKTYWLWILIIVYGLVCQGLRSASMSRGREMLIDTSETVVTFILLFEIIFRFAGDWRNFHKKPRNLIDVFIAIITTIILLPPIRNSGQPYAWLTVFQIMRIYRVVWAVPITRELIAKVLGNATGIGNLILFIFLMTFLVSILAVQLFRGDIPSIDINDNPIKITFFSLYNSFLGMYQVLSSENWTVLLYNVTAYNKYLNTGWIGAIFISCWFILSFFILLNMFIAVIQENFDVSEDEKRLQQVKAFLQKGEAATSSNLALSAIFRLGRSQKTKDPLDYGLAAMEMLLKDAVVKDFLDEEMDPLQQNASFETGTVSENSNSHGSGFFPSLWGKFLNRVWDREPNPFYSSLRFSGTNEALDARAMAREAVMATSQRKKAQRDYLARHPTYNNSLFIFAPTNPIRRLCQKIVGPGRGSERFDGVEPNRAVWYAFSAFIYGAVLTMVVLACITTPLYQKKYYEPDSQAVKWFIWTDLAFSTLFTVEALIKIIADGCFWTPNAYFRSLWGFVDGLVLVTLWIDVITTFFNDGTISRAVGAFKALRALRLLNVSDTARDTFHAVVIVGGWRVISAAFVSISLLIPFALYGVNLFNGKLVACNDNQSGIFNLSDCVGEYNSTPFSNSWNMPAPRVAQNPYFDFDNFGHSLFILFQIVSEEGWLDVMWATLSITGQGLQPALNASQGNVVFSIVFNLLATVFIVTLFISVFMRTYTEHTGVAFLTAEQRSWMELRKLLRQVAPSKRISHKATQSWQKWCYKRAVKKHGRWHRAVTIILVMHLALLTLEYYPEPAWWTQFRDYVFLVFTMFYLANVVIRIIGLTWARYRRSSWDVVALISVSGTSISTVLYLSNKSSDPYYQLYKLFLVSITLLLIPRNNSLDQLFKTAAASLTNITNLLATWGVLCLVYAIAMTQAFGLTRFGSLESNNMNFRTVPKALILLFRMSVGEGWNQIMTDFANIQPPFCTTGTFFNSDCGSPVWASFLFITWNILSTYIFVSLFVSLIYESFSYVYQRSSGLSVVNREETRRFKQAWATFDPEGTGYISKENFPRLLGELSGIFAMRIYDVEDSVRRILEDCKINTRGPRVGSIGSTSQATGIDLKALNERIARIDAKKIRERRHRFNIFYEEVMVSADPDRGISFPTVLMILAHNNVINDSKSLKLDEFLRRRARLQRVEEEVRRRVVVSFFDTLFWHRRFRKHMDRLKSARMTDIPQFGVPEIIVDDEGERQPGHRDPENSPFLSATHIPGQNSSFNDVFGFDGNYPYPETPSATSSPARSPRLAPHQPSNSGHGLNLQEPVSPSHSRQGSAVSAENVYEVFTESAWGESLRRSFTMRRQPGDI